MYSSARTKLNWNSITNIIRCIMLTLILFSILLNYVFVVDGFAKMLGPGKWTMLNVMKCSDDDRYPYKFDVTRKKINRTHDGFNGWFDFDETIDETHFATRIDICKYVDGGCKPYQTMIDECFCCFINKYAKDNVEKALTLAGAETNNCPIKAGKYELKKFIFDYTELPEDGIYGQFGATMYLIKDGTDVACLEAILEFVK